MKNLFICCAAALMFSCNNSAQQTASAVSVPTSNQQIKASMNFYDIKVNDINGNSFDFSQLKGKKVLLVNTASECGFTPQYAELEKLYKQYGGDTFVVIAVPSNDFGGQEPGSASEIKSFCSVKYGIDFPIMEKMVTKGAGQSPLYQWLTSKEKNGVKDSTVMWNFHKFFIDEKGNLVTDFSSSVSPLDSRIVDLIKA
ncbi:glutathione peroxidase [Flavobacterium aurantiibacter]|uniref:Glutathione peroxidase n=1 Tax=Flavobacterium aurantiibacter TaxID=2023067 RepID=A0A255ZX12_9FLAO|nr:glutathione peroxidase [Flavobacterium aurantiibacter]OYQ45455.1 glutathione peroxidase [Flavobacterium aurantiibacter]